jgi:SNF2 family DNA or RNA helicase
VRGLIDASNVCSICFENMCSVITECSHTYCHECIARHMQCSSACPLCRSETLPGTTLALIKDGVANKLDALGQMIRQLNAPAMVYAQWRSMMRPLKAVLAGARVQTVTLEGSAHRRQQALRCFQDSECGVLLLCMQDSFSGLHLPSARHVVFAHTLLGERNAVADLERQAIARAMRIGQQGVVTVHTVVVANTREEGLWRARREGWRGKEQGKVGS